MHIEWWWLVTAGVIVYTLGQVVGVVGLMRLALWFSNKEKKVSKRYPENVH